MTQEVAVQLLPETWPGPSRTPLEASPSSMSSIAEEWLQKTPDVSYRNDKLALTGTSSSSCTFLISFFCISRISSGEWTL